MIKFDNDYTRGAHPEILAALVDTNLVQTEGYGIDPYCKAAKEAILKECDLTCGDVHFLVGGTQTNAVMIDAMLHATQGVLAAGTAHINVHESGAIEASGHKVITLESEDGKLSARSINDYMSRFYDDPTWQHMVIPGMVYISQSTELGTIYSLEELEQISKACREWHLRLYLDGARLIYALQAPDNNVSLKDIAHLTDAFYIGGTKAGTLFGEALVISKPADYPHMFTLIKQHGALLAKGRLLGIQFHQLFSNDLYKRIGRNAIDKAITIRKAFLDKGWKPMSNSVTNQQIFEIPDKSLDMLGAEVSFDVWGRVSENTTAVRFTTDWATTQKEVDCLLYLLQNDCL